MSSTDVDRTLASAVSLIKGFYPDAAVPIHMVEQIIDVVLQPSERCVSFKAGRHMRRINVTDLSFRL